MNRVLLTFLVGLVVSLGTLVSGVDPVLAKNWNTTNDLTELEEAQFESGLIYRQLKSYNFRFSCTTNQNGQTSTIKILVNEAALKIDLMDGFFMNLDKKSGKMTTNLKPQDGNGKILLEQIKDMVKDYQKIAPFEDGEQIVIGKEKILFQEFFGIKAKVVMKPFKFVKYNGMIGVKSHYKSEIADTAHVGGQTFFIKGKVEGVVINHLGSALWVHENTRFTGKGNGRVIDFTQKRNCTLEGEDKFEKGLGTLAANAETSIGSENLQNQLKEYQAEIKKLEEALVTLEAKKRSKQKAISSDTEQPVITVSAKNSGQTNAVVSGKVSDNVEVAEVTVGSEVVSLTGDGLFETSFYIPRAGKTVEIVAFDTRGNKASKSLFLERGAIQGTAGPVFSSLNPSGKRVKPNKDALALIIGVADYERTPAKAAYADKDAKTFYDYAMLKLGISAGNIKELVNVDANRIDVGLAIKDWIARTTKQGSSDIYVFFAGHGLASQSGEEMYLLPYDGSPRLLEDSAISRERLFTDIASANPRSVTVFLDTCYSGTSRGTDMLVTSRPIAIKALKQSVPDNFTVMTAARGDQTAKPLEEAKHGMFSYFLMKGMEGEADQNSDNKITAGELHQYVQSNVVQQSSGSQTPELQGDANRVLVRFQ